MSTPLLSLSAARLGYGRTAILACVDLLIAPGEFLLIGGPNGGGKTTLLRSLAGLNPLLGGRRMTASGRIGYVPQVSAADQSLPMTAWEFVALGASAAKPWWRGFSGERRRRVSASLEACQVLNLAGERLERLSGGQRQRVLLARALALEPACLLLDEPTAGVDARTQLALAAHLAMLNRERGLAVVLVTHEDAPFLSAVTRRLWVHGGACHALPVPAVVGVREESEVPGCPA